MFLKAMQRKYNVASMKNIIKRHSLIHKKNKVVVHFSTFINQPFNNDNNKQYVKYTNNIQINKNSLYNYNKYWLREFHASSSGMSMDDVLLTPVCAKRINSLNKKSGNNEYLRISVESGGCSGFQYKFMLESNDELDEDDDHVFERDGAKVVIDDVSYEFVKGSTIDFEEEMIRSSFAVINNPNSESGCGCGVSFAAKIDI